MKKIILLTLILTATLSTAIAQSYTRIQDVDKLKKEKEVLAREYPHLFEKSDISDIFRIDDSHTMVAYTRDEVYYETIVNSGRKDMLLLETAEYIEKSEIPGPVKAAVESNTKGEMAIEKQFRVKRPYGDQLFRIDINSDQREDIVTLYFDALGHPAESPL